MGVLSKRVGAKDHGMPSAGFEMDISISPLKLAGARPAEHLSRHNLVQIQPAEFQMLYGHHREGGAGRVRDALRSPPAKTDGDGISRLIASTWC